MDGSVGAELVEAAPSRGAERADRAAEELAGLGVAAYLGTGSVGWAVLLLVVGVPVVVLPVVLLIGMVLEAREDHEA